VGSMPIGILLPVCLADESLTSRGIDVFKFDGTTNRRIITVYPRVQDADSYFLMFRMMNSVAIFLQASDLLKKVIQIAEESGTCDSEDSKYNLVYFPLKMC
jgi:hypothetical protein